MRFDSSIVSIRNFSSKNILSSSDIAGSSMILAIKLFYVLCPMSSLGLSFFTFVLGSTKPISCLGTYEFFYARFSFYNGGEEADFLGFLRLRTELVTDFLLLRYGFSDS